MEDEELIVYLLFIVKDIRQIRYSHQYLARARKGQGGVGSLLKSLAFMFHRLL